ncbi:DUF58 domain-containing protein [Celerinatantimonas yamalensis]|uniref:DUF58 domain-containing protein n=1 Tax=Celerinatantimonas yamalensis TaxID=559956 RepID=A0ABW9G298_9GAMM
MFAVHRASPIELSLEQLLQCRFIHYHPGLTKQLSHSRQAGQILSPQRGHGMEFDQVRQYQRGDDIRHIDWRVSARTGKTHSKIFREERDRPVIVAIDLSVSMFFGSQDKIKAMMACELAAILGWHSIGERQRTGLQLLTNDPIYTPLAQQQSRWLAQLQQLCTCYQQQLTHLTQSISTQNHLDAMTRRLPTGASLHIISDFYHYSDKQLAHLSHCAQRHSVTLWQVTDPMEFSLPEAAYGRLSVAHGTTQSWLRPQSKRFKQAYQSAALARQQRLQTQLAQYVLPLHQLSTSEDWHAYF